MSTHDANTLPPDDDRSGPSKKLIGSAVVVGIIVLLGVVLSLGNLFGDKTGPSPTTAPSPSTTTSTDTASSSSSTTASEASMCGLTDVQMTGTVAAAPAATWTLVGTVAAPSIKDQGPGKVEADGYRSCYARTPTGALLAAANYSAIGSYGPLRKKFYAEATVPGPGRDALLKKTVPGAADGGTRIQIAGFRLLRYDGVSADVDLAFRTSSGAIGATVVNLQWSEGDWKIRVADDGSELSPFVQLPTLSGYTAWSGA